MTSVIVNTYTHSVVYVADNILKSMKDIIRLSGLDPTNLVDGWQSKMTALQTWLQSRHLETVVLEIFDPKSDQLIGRWDIDVIYSAAGGDGGFWTDTEQIKYAVRKAGVVPGEAKYRLLLCNKPGRPDVDGWGPASYRSTEGFIRHSLGSTIEHNGLSGSSAYWRKS
ncbi:MAG: HORMA domain containing protein [Hyphomicrobium sp.]|nr:HORMA domain containing protein [Hyphomicrobium sp.]